MKSSIQTYIFKAALLTAAAASFAACGQNTKTVAKNTQQNLFSNNTSTQTQTRTDTGTDTHTGLPPIEETIRGVGYSETESTVTITVRTRDRLILEVTPGLQDRNVAGSGFAPQYSQAAIQVQVETTSKFTNLLSNGLRDGNAQTQRMDLSSSFTHTCPSNQPSCTQTVQIKFQKPNYDYWCLNYWYGCPYTHVHSTHPWNFDVKIHTNDTE